jgi:predicted acetyltransferase
METLFQFAVPQHLSQRVLEKIVPIAGGATVLPAQGYWVNGSKVEAEPVVLVLVGVDVRREGWLVQAVMDTLRESGEQAIWYVRDNVPRLVRFDER